MVTGKRADSAHVASEIMQSAIVGIMPPAFVTLEDKEMPFWKAIIDTRAEWTKIDLLLAVNLARCLCEIEEAQRDLKVQGRVIKNHKGTPIMNPMFTVLEQLSRRSAALATKLHVHATATLGEAKSSVGKNSAKRDALDATEDMDEDEDSLIAGLK